MSGGGIKEAVILGLIQGITEFLPVSSSGHLVFFQHLFGVQEPELLFDTVLHVATMTATIAFFRKDIAELFAGFARRDASQRRYVFSIVLSLLPTGVIGILIERKGKFMFASVTVVGVAFAITGLVLLASLIVRKSEGNPPGPLQGILVGISQGIAVVPGISRSGATIVTGMFLGMGLYESFRFSFLVSVPAIAGAMVVNTSWGNLSSAFGPTSVAAGFISALVSGYASLLVLKKTVLSRRLHYYAPYLFLLSFLLLVFVK